MSSDPGFDPGKVEKRAKTETEAPKEDGSGKRNAILKLFILALIIVGGILLERYTAVGEYLSRDGVGALRETLQTSPWAPLIFVLIYSAAMVLALPGTILTLLGGALFGTFWGVVWNSIGANIGANLAFLLGRFLGRDGLEKIVGDRLDRLDRATRDHGFRGLLTLRLIPLVPFNALNFGSGLTAISWPAYALATAVGILPGTIVYTFFADALLQGSQEASREAFIRVLIAGALLILIAFLPTIVKKMNLKLPGGAALLLLALGLSPAPIQSAQALPDHGAFTEILQEVVEGPRVDYALLQKRHEDDLRRYIERLSATDPGDLARAPEEDRLAFWLNAYNACMLKQVVEHYPIEPGRTGLFGAIRNRVAGYPDSSPWQIPDVFDGEHCPVAGEKRSQDEIEHEIIRPRFGEPRIHFAVNCAAASCPVLAEEAYVGELLEEQLERQVRVFMENPEHFRIERGTPGILRVNKVLDWYDEDFGGVEGIKRFFADYVSGKEREILQDPSTRVRFFDYDWSLNDASR